MTETFSIEAITDIMTVASEALRETNSEGETSVSHLVLADRLDEVRAQIVALDALDDPEGELEYTTYYPQIDTLNENLVIFKLVPTDPGPAPAPPVTEPVFHLILERNHWESMGRPNKIKVPVMNYREP